MIIATIVSKWHLSNLIALLDRENKKLDYLIINPQSNINNNSRYRIKPSDIENFNNLRQTNVVFGPVKFSIKTIIINLIQALFGSEKLEIISPANNNYKILGFIRLKRINKITFTIIDEGTASYVSTKEHEKISSKSLDNNKNISPLSKNIKNMVKEKIFKSIFPTEKKLLFKVSHGKLVVNSPVQKSLRRYYTRAIQNDQKQNSNVILIIIDFYDHFGDLQYFQDLYKKVISHSQLHGKTYIKPHPNDLRDYSNWISPSNIIASFIEAEEIAASLKPNTIIGGISTSTFTIPAIFNIRTVTLLNMYQQSINLDCDYRRRFKYFQEISKDIAEHPIAISEIKFNR